MQLTLPVTLPTDETFANFVPGANAEIVALLKDISESLSLTPPGKPKGLKNSSMPMVLLTAADGLGKSHLLYALCHQMEVNDVPHCYVNLATAALEPLILEGLEQYRLVCLDNIHAVLKASAWEQALFDLCNRVTETQQCVIVAASRIRLTAADIDLPDLFSRFQWGLSYHLQGLNDQERMALLQLKAAQRGIHFSSQAMSFIMHHADRHPSALVSLLERLDQRSLSEGRKISVNMVKRELDL